MSVVVMLAAPMGAVRVGGVTMRHVRGLLTIACRRFRRVIVGGVDHV
jgi:hypothetical protein